VESEKATSLVAKVSLETVLSALFAWLLTAAGSLTVFIFVSEPWAVVRAIRWPLGLALGGGFGLVVLWLRHRKPAIYRYDYPDVTFRYEVLRRSCTYRITTSGDLHYAKTLRLRALQNQLDDYVDKVNWSGGATNLPMGDAKVAEISPVNDRVGMWTFYRVHFGRTLAKGEEIEFHLTWPPIRDWVNARPFVAMSTDEPTHRLEFHVQIPPAALRPPANGSGCRAVLEHLRAVESLIPFRSEERMFDDNGSLVWIIDRPRLYRYFKVRWFWSLDLPSAGRQAWTIPGQVVPSGERQIGTTEPPR
jgi:hypothetical protein